MRINFFKSYHPIHLISLVILSFSLIFCEKNAVSNDPIDKLQLLSVKANDITLNAQNTVPNIAANASFSVRFSSAIDTITAKEAITLKKIDTDTQELLNFNFDALVSTISVIPVESLENQAVYILDIASTIKGAQNQEFPGISYRIETINGSFSITTATINTQNLLGNSALKNVQANGTSFNFSFSTAVSTSNFNQAFSIIPSVNYTTTQLENPNQILVTIDENLQSYQNYSMSLNTNFEAENGHNFEGLTKAFSSGLDSTLKMPRISDEELLTKIQQTTFRFFWDYAHPVSGLTRERLGSGETVTIGGSGFGLMAIPIGIERGFISRQDGVNRVAKVVDFLAKADRFHGVWPHWMNGSTGRTIPFSENDNGADLVETAFMAQGLITVRQYLNYNNSEEAPIVDKINVLLDEIEWNWFTRGNQNVLYWHWSPDKEWAMNMRISGYNEALIVYILAATSKNFAIEAEAYHQGWARNGAIRNGRSFYGEILPLGYDFGGPLFFAHYSFLGLNPNGLSDDYANYWEQNVQHSLINQKHSIANPQRFIGYSKDSWGLTASDNPFGYSAHEPTRDNGTITPTAALSSIPYTPDESMMAIKHFYYLLGDKLWGPYGFYDAFNPTQNWWANSYLAIDQGPILIMIENYRSSLCWDLFMSAPELNPALNKLGFTYSMPKTLQK